MNPHQAWFYSRWEDGETWTGGHPTREQAIKAARADFDPEDGFYVTQATNPPIRLADWIGASDALSRANEEIAVSDRVCYGFDDTDVFDVTTAQEKDLTERLKRACDEWQAAHGLTFAVRTFESMEVAEYIEPLKAGGVE